MDVAPIIDNSITDREHSQTLLREMLRIRRFEEKCAENYGLGKIRGFLHLYIGEEAIAAGAMKSLKPDDAIVATYREHGHALAREIPMAAVMAEMFGKATGVQPRPRRIDAPFDETRRFYGGYAIVGGGLPIAVGLALADKMQKRARVTACFFGDGAVAEGEFHESLNLAALWKLPVLFICENNLYAMGTALKRHQAQTDITLKAQAEGVKAEAVDGMDVLAVEAATKRAADFVRENVEPYLLEFHTYRFRAHSMYDAELYRTKEEVEEWKKRCPIANFISRLRGSGLLTDDELAALESSVAKEIDEAVAFAETSEWEPVEDLLKDVHTPENRR